MQRYSVTVLIISSLFLACGFLSAQSQAGSDQLTQYVRDARKAGLKDAEIEKNAEAAGWQADAVKSAMALAEKPAQPLAPSQAAGAEPAATAEGKPATRPEPQKMAESKLPLLVTQPAEPAAAPPPSKDRKAPDDYVIGAGDVLQIAVWKEPDASVHSAVVRPDGKISMPLLKEVPVLGLTVVQAEQLITQELAKFLTAPDVTVIIEAINSKKIYITGAVKKEGPIPYSYQMTVLQAISEAGGLTDYAKRKKIYVLHNENGRQFTFPFNYDEVLKGQHMELNVELTPGDTVVVPH
jgi:polysaccharide export outer membrane protein